MLSRITRFVSNNQLLDQFIRQVSTSFGLVVLGTAAGFALRLVLVKSMGVEMYGDYTYATAWMMSLLVLSVAGWDAASVRFVAAYHGRSLDETLKVFRRHSQRRVLMSAGIVSGLTSLVVLLLYAQMDDSLAATFLVMSVALFALTFITLNSKSLLAFGNVVLGVGASDLFIKLLLLASILAIWQVFGEQLTSVTVMSIHLAVIVGMWFIVWRALCRLPLARTPIADVDQAQRLEWNQTANGLNVLAVLRMVSQRIDVIVLGLFLGTTEAGIYATVALITSLIAFGLRSLNFVISPMIAELYEKQRLQELQNVLSLAALGIAAYVFSVSSVLIVAGKPVLRIFDPAFVAGYNALLILALGQSIDALFGSVNSLLVMTGRQRVASTAVVASSTVSLTMNFLLIPLWGMNGAALAKTLVLITWNTLMYIYVKREMGLDPTLFSLPARFFRKRR